MKYMKRLNRFIAKKKKKVFCCEKRNICDVWQFTYDNCFLNQIPDFVREYCSLKYNRIRDRYSCSFIGNNNEVINVYDGDWIIRYNDGTMKRFNNTNFESSFILIEREVE